MNYQTRALLLLAVEYQRNILMKNSTVDMLKYIADLTAYQNRTNKNDTLFFEAVFSDNRDMKDTKKRHKIRLIKAL